MWWGWWFWLLILLSIYLSRWILFEIFLCFCFWLVLGCWLMFSFCGFIWIFCYYCWFLLLFLRLLWLCWLFEFLVIVIEMFFLWGCCWFKLENLCLYFWVGFLIFILFRRSFIYCCLGWWFWVLLLYCCCFEWFL